MSDRALRASLIRLAHAHPEFRKDILPLLREAAEFPADSIGEKVPGPEGIPGSDAQKPWAKGHFTQQESNQLHDKQEGGQLSDGKVDPVGKTASSLKEAAEKAFRAARAAGKTPEQATTAARAAMAAWKRAQVKGR